MCARENILTHDGINYKRELLYSSLNILRKIKSSMRQAGHIAPMGTMRNSGHKT
jgi:hypothetical protein